MNYIVDDFHIPEPGRSRLSSEAGVREKIKKLHESRRDKVFCIAKRDQWHCDGMEYIVKKKNGKRLARETPLP